MGSLEPFKPYSNGLRLYADSPNFSPSIRDQVLPLCGVMIVEQIGVSSTSQFDLAVCGVSWTDFERCVCVCLDDIASVCGLLVRCLFRYRAGLFAQWFLTLC